MSEQDAAAPGAQATVFGLDVRAEAPLPFLAGASARSTGRVLSISERAGGMAVLGWPAGGAPISDELEADGTVSFRIEAHPEAGYLFWGPRYGASVLSPDGRRLLCTSAPESRNGWQRLLIAQILPFAALLHGLEVFHASAVAVDGRAVAFVGPSGAGKTSLALELCGRGARFFADDVLALERRGATLLAHTGAPLIGLSQAEALRRQHEGERLDHPLLAEDPRERLLGISPSATPAPLTSLFLLDRRTHGPPSPSFEPVKDAQTLLAATFNFVLDNPQRLRGLLETCALAARARVERVLVGPTTGVSELASALERRLREPT